MVHDRVGESSPDAKAQNDDRRESELHHCGTPYCSALACPGLTHDLVGSMEQPRADKTSFELPGISK
jgi:hypothetical protein